MSLHFSWSELKLSRFIIIRGRSIHDEVLCTIVILVLIVFSSILILVSMIEYVINAGLLKLLVLSDLG